MIINNKKAGVILGYMTQFVTIASGLLYTPIMIRLLGQSEYGLYQLVASVIANLGLLNMGFSSSYVRFFSIEKAKGDEKRIAQFNGMFITIFAFISVICAISGIIMITNAKAIFGEGLTSYEYEKVKILFLIMVINLIITFIGTVFNCSIIAYEEFFFQKLLCFLDSLLNPFICLPLLILGFGSVGMVSVSLVLNVTMVVSNMIFCIKKLKMKFLFDKFDLPLLRNMWAFTFFIFLNQIIDQINWTTDKFLLGRLMNTSAVAVYGIASSVNTMYISFSTVISNVFTPSVNLMVARNVEKAEINRLFIKIGRIQYMAIMLILSGFIIFGQYFIKIWVGEEYSSAYITILLLIVPVTIPLIQNLGIDIQRAYNKHKVRSIVYAIIAVANIFISIFFIRHIGFHGAALGTAISLFVGNILFMNWYYAARLDLNIKEFWKNIIVLSKGLIIPTILGAIILFNVNYKSIREFFVWIIIFSAVYALSMIAFGMNRDERNLFIGFLKRRR